MAVVFEVASVVSMVVGVAQEAIVVIVELMVVVSVRAFTVTVFTEVIISRDITITNPIMMTL
jgi:hypothetical protein